SRAHSNVADLGFLADEPELPQGCHSAPELPVLAQPQLRLEATQLARNPGPNQGGAHQQKILAAHHAREEIARVEAAPMQRLLRVRAAVLEDRPRGPACGPGLRVR